MYTTLMVLSIDPRDWFVFSWLLKYNDKGSPLLNFRKKWVID